MTTDLYLMLVLHERKLCRRIHWKSALALKAAYYHTKGLNFHSLKKSSKLLLFQRFEQNRFPSWYYIHVVKVGLYSFKEFPDALFQDLSYPIMPGMFDLSLCLFKDTDTTALYSSLFNVITFQGKGHMINCFRSKGKRGLQQTKLEKESEIF